MEISREQWDQFKGSKVAQWVDQAIKEGIIEAQGRYFDSISEDATSEKISTEALHMKGFIDGLKEALHIEPTFEEKVNE